MFDENNTDYDYLKGDLTEYKVCMGGFREI